MLEGAGEEGGEGVEAAGDEAGRGDQWGRESGAQRAGGERQETTQSRNHTTSQEGRQVWDKRVEQLQGQGGGGEDGGECDIDTTEVIDKTVIDRELYTILYTNARSILNKIDQLKVTVFEKKPSFIMICESFVREDIVDAYLSIDGYQLVVRQHGRDTIQGKCRGLLIYVKDGI